MPLAQQVGSSPELALCFAGAGIYQLQSELQKRHWEWTRGLGPCKNEQWTHMGTVVFSI